MLKAQHYVFNDQLRPGHRPCGTAAHKHIEDRRRGSEDVPTSPTKKIGKRKLSLKNRGEIIRSVYDNIQDRSLTEVERPCFGEIKLYLTTQSFGPVVPPIFHERTTDYIQLISELRKTPTVRSIQCPKCKMVLPIIMSWELDQHYHDKKAWRIYCPICIRKWEVSRAKISKRSILID